MSTIVATPTRFPTAPPAMVLIGSFGIVSKRPAESSTIKG